MHNSEDHQPYFPFPQKNWDDNHHSAAFAEQPDFPNLNYPPVTLEEIREREMLETTSRRMRLRKSSERKY